MGFITLNIHASSINIGIYCGDSHVVDSKLLIREQDPMSDLLEGLKTPCICGMASNPWALESTIQMDIYNGISYLPFLFLTLVYLFLRRACYLAVIPLSPREEDMI